VSPSACLAGCVWIPQSKISKRRCARIHTHSSYLALNSESARVQRRSKHHILFYAITTGKTVSSIPSNLLFACIWSDYLILHRNHFFYLVGWDFAGPLGSYKSQYCGHILAYCTYPNHLVGPYIIITSTYMIISLRLSFAYICNLLIILYQHECVIVLNIA
jgi:hypothetical protein